MTHPRVRQDHQRAHRLDVSKIVFQAAAAGRSEERQPDITRARTLLGWEPKVALEDGLRRTIEYFRERSQRAAA